MTKFSDILASLDPENAPENIARLKTAVVDQVKATDTRVVAEFTECFNHSYVPDIVLSWPGTGIERLVFLRTAQRRNSLMRDIEVLGQDKPILMPLSSRERQQADEGENPVHRVAQQSDVLIADPDSLEVLESEAQSKPVVSLLSHAILQGGRGMMTSEVARSTSTGLNDGINGAGAGDTASTTAAIDLADSLLDSHRASQINRLLHALWVSSGAGGSTFPGAAGIAAMLDVESLRYILGINQIEEIDFWQRLASGLTLERVCELGNFGATPNLQRLLSQRAAQLDGKACRVLRVDGNVDRPEWSIVNGNLVLAVAKDRAFVSPRRLDELPEQTGQSVSITTEGLKRRANEAALTVKSIRVTDGASALSLSSETDNDIARDEALLTISTALPTGALLSATVRVDERDLILNFDTRTASGQGPSKFKLGSLLNAAGPTLMEITGSGLQDLHNFLESGSTPAGESRVTE